MAVKKILVTLVCTVLAGILTSCGSYYDEEEIGAALAELLPASLPLNEIYFGDGLPMSNNEDEVKAFYAQFDTDIKSINYHPVSKDCGYASIEEIKQATLAVYSDSYSEYLFTLAFNGISEVFGEGTESQVTMTASYARFLEQAGVLTVRVGLDEEALELNRTYDTADYEVMINRERYVTAEVQSYVNGEKDEVVEVKLVYESDGWRLDSPTY